MNIHQKMVLVALSLFGITMIVEKLFPTVIYAWWWFPIPFEMWVKAGFLCAPCLPTLLAFGILVDVLVVNE